MKTTLEEAREASHDNLVENLQALLEKSYDAEEGFKTAMIESEHAGLKEFLKTQAANRSAFQNELSDAILNLNETPKDSGSVTGKIHRAWMDIKTSVSSDKEEAMLEECLRGDKASVSQYEDVLENNNLPLAIQTIVTRQLDHVQKVVSTVKTLEDLV